MPVGHKEIECKYVRYMCNNNNFVRLRFADEIEAFN